MGQKRTRATKREPVSRKVTPSQKKELAAMLTAIDQRRAELVDEHPNYAKLETFASACGHSVSTWHAWRRDNPTSPKFFDLRDFARLVGYDVQFVSEGDKTPVALKLVSGAGVTDHTKQLIAVSEGLSPDDQRVLLNMALSFARVCGNGGGGGSPPDPTGDHQGSHLGRTSP